MRCWEAGRMGVTKGGGREPEGPRSPLTAPGRSQSFWSVRRHGAPATRWLGPELRAQAASTHRAQPCPRRAATLETKSLTYTHRDALPTRRRRRSCYHRPRAAGRAPRTPHVLPTRVPSPHGFVPPPDRRGNGGLVSWGRRAEVYTQVRRRRGEEDGPAARSQRREKAGDTHVTGTGPGGQKPARPRKTLETLDLGLQ